ncbi:ABC transporter ATP-binding protein [Aequorivita sp. H23M31]|uniref:ABC transporter ATP-binding protein n=1 Tax=Aequorivita ciconiae TaxID=2494375 RepID=A0A410G4C8_9FLAO|nr:ABC transporter ATP-binding protein [Aequorivita sp. H23M31]QAA82137.1 ABC transporter ATP-binding protein [Aequorivita sp. H23M31]
MISLSKVIKSIIWPQRKILLFGVILIILNKAATLVLPGVFKYFVDDVVIQKDPSILNKILLVAGIAVIVQAITSYLLTKILSVQAYKAIAELRVKVQKRVFQFPVGYFEKRKSGETAKRVMDDVDGLNVIVGNGMVLFIGGIITFIFAFAILLYINVKLTIYVLIPLFVLGFVTLKAYKYVRPIFRKRRQIEAEVHGRLIESLSGIHIIKAYNAEKYELNIFEIGVNRIYEYYNKSLTAKALILAGATLIFGMSALTVLWIGNSMIVNNELSIGEFLSFALYLAFLIAPIIQIGNVGSLLTEAFAGLDRTEELLKTETEIDTKRNYQLKEIAGDIKFQNVCFSYPEGGQVLFDINFEASPGSITAIVGSSGAGKSTIAALLTSLITPQKGLITIDGIDLATVNLDSYRSHLGIVLQDDFLFEGTIRENILFSRPNASELALKEAVKSAYVNEFTDRFENGLETIIGERGVKLSGGQKQRISIARALLADPKILILDEATSNLDIKSEQMIQKSLATLIAGRTTFIIAHRLSTIQKADQILVIDDGAIVERGNHQDLMEAKGSYSELVTLQSRI